MLNISFFIATFSSIFWLVYGFKSIFPKMLVTTTLEPMYQGILIIFLPIAIIWGIFALVRSYFTERRTAGYIYNVIDQVKKNTETIVNLGEVLLSTETEIKNSFVVQEFNTLIADINEILSDIIKRSNSISSAQLEHLWNRTAGGERWILAKTFIEIINYQTDFSEHLKEKALKDPLLKGSILEFCSRYQTIRQLISANGNRKIFYDVIEYGALGKVFEILNSITLLFSKENSSEGATSSYPSEPITKPKLVLTEDEPMSFPSFFNTEETDTSSQIDDEKTEPTFTQTPQQQNIEEGLKAIREEILKPTISEAASEEIPAAPIISNFTETQMALRSIKNKESKPITSSAETKKTPVISLDELEKEINASPENNYDEYAYPFGVWLNGKNNK